MYDAVLTAYYTDLWPITGGWLYGNIATSSAEVKHFWKCPPDGTA